MKNSIIYDNNWMGFLMDFYNDVNLKHFTFLKYILDTVKDDHVTCKIHFILSCNRIDVPYYMQVKVSLTHCTGIYKTGIIHAMDIFNHERMYNITEQRYNAILDEFNKYFLDEEDDFIKYNVNDELRELTFTTMSAGDLREVLNKYSGFFESLDSLV